MNTLVKYTIAPGIIVTMVIAGCQINETPTAKASGRSFMDDPKLSMKSYNSVQHLNADASALKREVVNYDTTLFAPVGR